MTTANSRKRYAIVGAGSRISMFTDPIVGDFSANSALVAICDPSPTRIHYHLERLQRDFGISDIRAFAADAFEQMVRETQPDVVIVCTIDALHHDYIVRALELGCDVITEKPMTTDEVKCRAILDAAEKSNRRVRVCFNYRWAPGASTVYRTLRSGVIGNIINVNLEYMLNTSHGADYFRRWHSSKDLSGGLLVHKATHHFDLVNWWLDAIPEDVFAWGRLAFYGRENAIARGDSALTQYPRYTGFDCDSDPFALKLDEGLLKGLYREAEADSGYIRDENVFRDGITIEDTMSVLVKYRNGTTLNYSLNAFCPIEGYRVSFNGERGRVEYSEDHGAHIIENDEQSGAARPILDGTYRCKLRVTPHFQPSYEIPIPEPEGAHGGGDVVLQRQIFAPNPPSETLGRNAGPEQGAASILIGIAANHSMSEGRPVCIRNLVDLSPDATSLGELI